MTLKTTDSLAKHGEESLVLEADIIEKCFTKLIDKNKNLKTNIWNTQLLAVIIIKLIIYVKTNLLPRVVGFNSIKIFLSFLPKITKPDSYLALNL